MPNELEKLRVKAEKHRAEADRLEALYQAVLKETGASDVGKSTGTEHKVAKSRRPAKALGRRIAAVKAAASSGDGRFAKVSFADAVQTVLREYGHSMSSAALAAGLIKGGFPSKARDKARNFIAMVELLAAKGIIKKGGDRLSGIRWSLP